MSELPKGWADAELGDLLTKQSGFAFKSSEYDDEGHFLIRIGNVQDGEISLAKPKYVKLNDQTKHFELLAGDILTSLTGNIGRVARIEQQHLPAALNQRVARLVPADKLDDDGYLFCFLSSPLFRDALAALGKGGAQQNVSPKAISDIAIPLPPLPEQRRIVKKLDTLSARTTTARTHLTAIAKLVERMRGAVLSKALKGTLLPEQLGEGKPFELEALLTGIEQGWSPPCDNEPKTDEDQWAVLTTTALQRVNFSSSENKRLPAFEQPRQNLEVHQYDVLMTRKGPRIRCGVCCFVADTLPKCMFPDTVYRLGLKEDVDPEFFVYLMNSPELLREIDKIKSGGNESGLNLTHSRLKGLSINLWSIEIQRTVVAEIKSQFAKIDRLAVEAEKALKLTDRLDGRILAKAFAGELVPQDPTDEPATNLLARIRETRATAPKSKRGCRNKTTA